MKYAVPSKQPLYVHLPAYLILQVLHQEKKPQLLQNEKITFQAVLLKKYSEKWEQ